MKANEAGPCGSELSAGLGPNSEASGGLPALLNKVFIPADLDADSVAKRRVLASDAVSWGLILAKLAAGVAGTTHENKIRLTRTWDHCRLTAYVVSRNGDGLLVQADEVQAWLPANKVCVIDARTIEVPDWLRLRRRNEFHELDHRGERRPALQWNSDRDGNYEGGA
jgi:hypothetical protein